MDTRTLFLETLDELGRRTAPGGTEYDLVRAAHLLRQLLMDGEPLVDRVNRGVRLDIRYTVGRSPVKQAIMTLGPVFWAAQDALDPETGLPSTVPAALKRDAFLNEVIMYVRPHEITVRDVIAYLAHVEGGVHAGVPKDEKERALREVTEKIALGGYPPGALSLQAVARVVLRALEPLRQRPAP